MAEEDSPQEEVSEQDKQHEQEELEKMGVSSTWNILTSSKDDKKREDTKVEFRGFK